MNNNKEIMQQMLQDVVTHFSENPKGLRCINEEGRCLYNPPVNKPNSIGCAIGMYINTKKAKELDNFENSAISFVLREEENRKLLPKWMQKIDVEFLSVLQNLHDKSDYWTDNNISKKGKDNVKNICRSFGLDYKSIQFNNK